MKPIQTRYKGYHFRSRLEARWAVFFDHIGASWQYEPEGFDLGEYGFYLPDFLVDGYYVEVKPEPGFSPAFAKALGLARHGDDAVICVGGLPDLIAYPVFDKESYEAQDENDLLTVAINGSPKYGPYFWCPGAGPWERYEEFNSCDRTRRAIDAARSARFEFGESGAT